MGQGLTAVVALARGLVDRIVLVDQIPRLAFAGAVWQVGKGRTAIAGTEIGKGHMTVIATGRRPFCEGHFGHVGPGLQGQLGLLLLQRRELAERAQTTGGIAHRRRCEEGVGEVDHTVTVKVMPTGARTRQLIRHLVGGQRRLAIDQMIAAIIKVTEIINLGKSGTAAGCSQVLTDRQHCFLFKFRHVNTSLFNSRKF